MTKPGLTHHVPCHVNNHMTRCLTASNQSCDKEQEYDLMHTVISRVIWNQGTGLKGVTELYRRAVRGEGDSPLFKGVPRKAEKGYTCFSPRVRLAQRAQRLSHTNLMQS